MSQQSPPPEPLVLPGLELTPPPPAQTGAGPGTRPDPEELLEGLNEPQRAAVVHEGAPLLVVAGAGSGKTRVLTRRIAWLVTKRRVHPGSILAITFTNKAAAEMKERVEQLVGARARLMWVSTFHSACVRILRREADKLGLKSNFSIYDAADSKRLMTLIVRDLDLDPRQYQPAALLHWISNHKNELRDVDQVKAEARNRLEQTYAAAYSDYQRRLAAANALDFDDLIASTVHLFQAHPDVLESYRRRFRHVLVDEYQDTNHAQYALIHQLCGQPLEQLDSGEVAEQVEAVAPSELMVVGDADQSIYAFRGANVRNILDFEADFPDATSILLEQNYRSTQHILTAANAVIGNNSDRRPKRLWSDAGDGARIVGYVADDERDEARFVSDEIDELTDTGVRPGDIAVFYRTNAQSRVFEEVFVRTGQPYRVVGGVRFYERREVRDALAYLRALDNPDDEISLRRVLNTPRRGIGDKAEGAVQAFARREEISFYDALARAEEAPGLVSRSLKAVQGFASMMQELQSMVSAGERVDVILETVLDRTGYLAELEDSDDPQDGTRVDNLAELVAVAREFADAVDAGEMGPGATAEADEPEVETTGSTLGDFLERVALVADADQIPDAPDDEAQDNGVVTLMTLHTAKGLEFPVVFLTGLEDGVFPHSRALGDRPELEEERRLAYVGLTRARERLYVSRAMVRAAWGAPMHNPASRFLSELPVDLVDWRRTADAAVQWSRPDYSGTRAGLATPTAAGRRNFSAAAARADAKAKAKPARSAPSLSRGDRVVHDSFGMGTVVTVDGEAERASATIDFGSEGVKRLLLRYAPVEKL